MISLSENSWEKLPINDYRGRFFIEACWEYLSIKTPHFYQARIMNIISCSSEVLESLNEYYKKEKNLSNLKNSIEELKNCIDKDSVAATTFRELLVPAKTISNNCLTEKPNKTELNRLRVVCQSILRKSEIYKANILTELRNAVIGETDLDKKERNLKKLDELTGLYITDLLNDGYSPTYLYNRMQLLTRLNNYKGRLFPEQFNIITDSLKTRDRKYKVVFAIKTSNKTAVKSFDKLFNVNVTETIPVVTEIQEFAKLSRSFTPNQFIIIDVKTTDYIRAAWKGKEALDIFNDFVSANFPKIKLLVSEYCLTLHKSAGLSHKHTVSIDLIIKFLTSNSTLFEQYVFIENIPKMLDSTLDKKSIDHLSRSLRHLKLGREATALEQKLLNIWIALESLFIDTEKTIINSIIDYIPEIYGVKAVKGRIKYLVYLLSNQKVKIPETIRSKFNIDEIYFQEKFCVKKFLSILLDESSAIELFNSIPDKERVKFRIKTTYDEIKNPKQVFIRIDRTKNDVYRQLRRIYSYRNFIVHTGDFKNIKPQIINHLFDYLTVCYQAIFESISHFEGHTISINDILVCYKLGANEVYNFFKNKPDGYTYDELLIKQIC